jgi:predicted neutral ceramidase superfamily lipid hydrolase
MLIIDSLFVAALASVFVIPIVIIYCEVKSGLGYKSSTVREVIYSALGVAMISPAITAVMKIGVSLPITVLASALTVLLYFYAKFFAEKVASLFAKM